MEIRELDRIRFVTTNFGNLQGLRHLVPLGVVMLTWAGAQAGAGWAPMLLRAGVSLGALFLMAGATRYYRSTFGEVELPPVAAPLSELAPLSVYNFQEPARRLPPVISVVPRFLLLAWLVLAVFLLFQFLFWPPWVQVGSGTLWTGSSEATRLFFAQSIYFLCGSLFLGLAWLRRGGLLQSYPAGLAVLLLGLSVLAPRLAPEATRLWAALIVCGSSMVLAGLLDHWQLVRMLGRPAASRGDE